jgi:predicted HD phosphohydrolase
MFNRLAECTPAEWTPIMEQSNAYQQAMPDRILALLRQTSELVWAFPVDQLTHGLQTAALAERDNASDEIVLAALCHDIGKVISIRNHASIGAEMLRPYVAPDLYNVLLAHQHFQLRYTADHLNAHGIACRGEAREKYAKEPWYAIAEKFCDQWDVKAFDPSFATPPLEHFEPLVRAMCKQPRYPTIG